MPKPYGKRQRLARMAKVKSTSEMAEHWGVNRKTMYRWLRAEGIKAIHGNRPSMPPYEDLEWAREEEELTLEQIGRRYGVSRQRVHQWFKYYEEQT